MDTLPENPNKARRSEPVSTQGKLSDSTSYQIFSKETLLSLEELGDVLRSIRKRMNTEGYEIVGGVVRKKQCE